MYVGSAIAPPIFIRSLSTMMSICLYSINVRYERGETGIATRTERSDTPHRGSSLGVPGRSTNGATFTTNVTRRLVWESAKPFCAQTEAESLGLRTPPPRRIRFNDGDDGVFDRRPATGTRVRSNRPATTWSDPQSLSRRSPCWAATWRKSPLTVRVQARHRKWSRGT